MKRVSVWVVAALGVMGATAGAAAACQIPAGAAGIERGLVGWINGQRSKQGLGALRLSGKLHKAAAAHACDMADRGFFGHKGPGGPALKRRLKTAGYGFSAAVENIAKSRTGSADIAAKVWRESPPHMANILNSSIRDIGLAVVTDGTSVFYVFVGGAD